METVTAASRDASPAPDGLIEVRLTAIRYAARDTSLFEFRSVDGRPLPSYEPGAHIDLHLPNGQRLREDIALSAEPGAAIMPVIAWMVWS